MYTLNWTKFVNKMFSMNRLFFALTIVFSLCSCTHSQIANNQLRPVQMFHANSGANYIFLSNDHLGEK